MARSYGRFTGRLAGMTLLSGLICSGLAAAGPAVAQEVSTDQIVKALAPPATRGLSVQQPPNDADRAFIEHLRHRTRSLTVDEGDRVADLAKDRPKVDLEIFFGYNSAAITGKAAPQLRKLGEALRNPRLENSTIVIGGYTDAGGSDAYNQKLSERRAESVKKYLVERLKISAANLSTVGYGKRNLKNPADPFGAENRRVQIVNLSAPAEAKQ